MPDTAVITPDPAMAGSSPLSCKCAAGGAVAFVVAAGELDLATVDDLDSTLRLAEANAPLVVLDLRALEFIDSAGGHLILAADRRIRRRGGRLVVVRGSAQVDRLFALVGIDRRLDLVAPAVPSARAQAVLEDVAA